MLPLTDEMKAKIRALGINPDEAGPFIEVIIQSVMQNLRNVNADKGIGEVTVKRHDDNGKAYFENVNPVQIQVELLESMQELTDAINELMDSEDDSVFDRN